MNLTQKWFTKTPIDISYVSYDMLVGHLNILEIWNGKGAWALMTSSFQSSRTNDCLRQN